MELKLLPGTLRGTVTPPPSKSQAHRYLIAAALAKGESVIENLALSQDIRATLGGMTALGASCARGGDTIRGIGSPPYPARRDLPKLDCGESGSTLRFLIPVALAVAGGGIFTGHGRLMDRPQTPYEQLFREKGIAFVREGDALRVEGELTPGCYALAGNISSQFITGLLYALPLLPGDSDIRLTTPLESAGYIDLTLDALHTFGIAVEPTQTGWHIPGNQHYTPCRVTVESDYSQAAFWMTARLLGSEVTVLGLRPDSPQGDRVITSCLDKLSAPGEVTLDVRDCPDLLPALALAAALRAGETTHLVGAARLRMKESDRLDTVTTQLNALGADLLQTPDALTIYGVDTLRSGRVSGCNDHRIAMMLGIAATRCDGPVLLEGAECVAKSYPNFWEVYTALGGTVLQ